MQKVKVVLKGVDLIEGTLFYDCEKWNIRQEGLVIQLKGGQGQNCKMVVVPIESVLYVENIMED